VIRPRAQWQQADERGGHREDAELDPQRAVEGGREAVGARHADARFEFGLDALVRGIETMKG
jgi:hypothetical protein